MHVFYHLYHCLLSFRPSLGAQMSRVFAAGGIYGVFSFLDGITRSYSVSLPLTVLCTCDMISLLHS